MQIHLLPDEATPVVCRSTLRACARHGDVLCICPSRSLSDLYDRLRTAAAEIDTVHRIEVFHSRCIACGEGLLVRLASRDRANGAELSHVIEHMEQTAPQICHLFLQNTPPDGDISVVMTDLMGKCIPCRRCADRKTALRYIAQMYNRTVLPSAKKICIAHANCPEDAAYLAGQIGVHTHMTTLHPQLVRRMGAETVALFYRGTLRTQPPI